MSNYSNQRFLEYWYEFALDQGMSDEQAIAFAESKFEELS